MKKDDNEGVDDLFKKKLEDPVDQAGFREEDWTALEKMLDGDKKRKGIIYWLPVISSVAALLLIFLGWWALRPQVKHQNSTNKLQLANSRRHSDTVVNGGSKQQSATPAPKPVLPPVNYANNQKAGKSNNNKSDIVTSAGNSGHVTVAGDNGNNLAATRSGEALFTKSPVPVFEPEPVNAEIVTPVNFQTKNIVAVTGNKPVTKSKTGAAFHPQYTLSVLAAPDINGVGSFQQGKVGTNVGLLFSAGLVKKLTITTGVIYSDKPYVTPFSGYHTAHQFSTTPTNVDANCSMLDIPLNVSYQFYNKQQNKISVGTGLSSYIMLRESYQFNYSNPYASGPSNYVVPHSKGYFFGVLNLNATYQRQINSKFALGVQPYLKVPLKDLGYSQVRLQSLGLAVGVSWNLGH